MGVREGKTSCSEVVFCAYGFSIVLVELLAKAMKNSVEVVAVKVSNRNIASVNIGIGVGAHVLWTI